mmetsp:Transcript_24004/g.65454  ORF Transcript_24004/g.65454 Transcript_24004/m.65454 type:complete len:398 (-) Transcript_24004:40-1233(-)
MMQAPLPQMGPPQESGIQGMVKSWNGAKGYGFINCDQIPGDVFFSRNELPEEAREVRGTFLEGRMVSFDAHQGVDGRSKASSVQILAAEGKPLPGMIKSYSEQNRYGFLNSSSLADDVRFQSSDLPPMAPGANLKGKLVIFELNQLADGKLRVAKMQFQTSKIAAAVNAYGGSYGGSWGASCGGYGGGAGGPPRLALPMAPHQGQQLDGSMLTGTVKSFSDRNGYGFINAPGQMQDIKFGKADLLVDSITVGALVCFQPAYAPDGRMQARQVQLGGQKRQGSSFGPPGSGGANGRPAKQQRTGPWQSPSPAGPAGPWRSPGAGDLTPGQIISGTVKSYIPSKGFGFITSPDVDGDVYFMRQVLPADAQGAELKGSTVSFELTFAPDGKHRASSVAIL